MNKRAGHSRASLAPAPVPAPPPRSRRYHVLAPVLVLVGGALVYANSLAGPFVLDDQASIIDNGHLRRLWPPADALTADRDSPLAGRPIASLSLALNYAIGGLDVRGYHLANVALHLWAALLLFAIVRGTLELPKVRGRVPGAPVATACISALLWVVHPLNTEAVDYVTQRTELVMAVSLLLTLFSSLRAHRAARPAPWLALAVVGCAAGMAAKESMAVCPLLVVLFDRAFVYDSFRQAFRARWRFHAALGATWVVLVGLNWSGPRLHSAGFSTGITPWTYLLNQCAVIAHYAMLVAWPRDLVFIYGVPQPVTPADVLPSAALLVSLALLALLAWRLQPMVGFLGLWVFITLAPASSVVPIATEVGAERRMYLPLAGVIVLSVVIARSLIGRLERRVPPAWRDRPIWPLAGWGLASAIALALGAGTVERNRDYQSTLVLAQTALAAWPSGAAHHTVATELMLIGRTDDAWPHLEAAVRDTPRAHYTMGVALMDRQRWGEAVDHLQAFVRAEPSLVQAASARALMGQAWLQQHAPEPAAEQFRLVLQMQPSNAGAAVGLADALSQMGRFDDAIAAYRRAGSLAPLNAQAVRNLALLLFNRGDYVEAESFARRAVRARPSDAVGHDLLGMALAAQSRRDESMAELREALRLDPTNTDVQEHLARIVGHSGGRP